MKTLIILTILGLATTLGCAKFGTGGDNPEPTELSSKLTEGEARDQSPTGDICVEGEITEVFVPSNRGRGNNNGTWQTVDNRTFEPAYLRGDVNYDGVVGTREDAMLAVKQIYTKQIAQERCAAVADIGTFPQGLGADSFYTAEDIYQWNQVKKTGHYLLEQELICLSDCVIINHMAPGFKKNN